MFKILLLVSVALSLLACKQEGRIYENHQELSPEVEWFKKDTRSFEVPIENIDLNYDLRVSFRFATGFQYQYANVKMTETSPSGQVKVHDLDLKVRKENGEYMGEAGYDIWDSEHLVEAKKQYTEKGTYTYVLEHTMPKDPLYYAMEIGIIVDKSK
jgi:gliding motility-associated lipoprotein GldH